jgi:hypothetical protein
LPAARLQRNPSSNHWLFVALSAQVLAATTIAPLVAVWHSKRRGQPQGWCKVELPSPIQCKCVKFDNHGSSPFGGHGITMAWSSGSVAYLPTHSARHGRTTRMGACRTAHVQTCCCSWDTFARTPGRAVCPRNTASTSCSKESAGCNDFGTVRQCTSQHHVVQLFQS